MPWFKPGRDIVRRDVAAAPVQRPGSGMRALVATMRAFRRREDGGFAITFGLTLLPIMLAVGVAVDYGVANSAKAKLDAALDAAALAAVSKGAITKSKSDAQTLALNMFNADAAGLKGVKITKVSADVADTSTGRTVTASYTAAVPTSLMGVAGFKSLTVGGVAKANSGLLTYIDFYLLLDNTPSMGVGATLTDIDKMVANTPDKCAFACHDLSDPDDYYKLAKKLGVKMRIDIMRTATQQLMDTAAATQAASGQFRMAIYTFGDSATKSELTTIQSLTSNLSTAKTAAAKIDLMTIPYQNYASDTATNFHDVLEEVEKEIPSQGTGSSSSRLKYLFFVSDGVADRENGSPGCSEKVTVGQDPKTLKKYTRCQEPLDVGLCTKLKDRGIKIAVLYTTYLPLPTNAWYNSWIAPFTGKIAKNMEACASPGLYFEVSPTQGISEAMTALFKKAVLQARLTQ
jgi:Flp pilus assembly protein TadG